MYSKIFYIFLRKKHKFENSNILTNNIINVEATTKVYCKLYFDYKK